MGERRQAADPDALATACAVLDNEVEQIVRLRGARDEVQRVTQQVRVLVGAIQPLEARQAALARDIQALEAELARHTQAREQAVQAEQARAAQAEQVHQAQMARYADDARAVEAAHVLRLTELAEAERQAHLRLQTVQGDLAQQQQEFDRVFARNEAAMQARLGALQGEIVEAERLRDALTALRH